MEAEEYFRAALEIKELKLGSDDLSVAETLSELGLCVRKCDRSKEAEDFFWRALEVQEEKLGEHEQVCLVQLVLIIFVLPVHPKSPITSTNPTTTKLSKLIV